MSFISASCRQPIWKAVRHFLGVADVLPLLVFGMSVPAQGADTAASGEARQLVAAAVQAEVAGEPSEYSSLLQSACRSAPDNKLPHWLLGQVQIGGKWMSAQDAERRAAHDPLQSEYRERRLAAAAMPKDQLRLARWCRDNRLHDEAQLHWSIVLSLDPTNKEAQRSSDVHWHDGLYQPRNQIAEQKSRAQAAKDAAKYWEPIIAKWRRAVAGRDLPAHDAALAEIRAIKRLDAIPSMEAITLGRDAHQSSHAEECVQITLPFLDALARMPEQAATESLVRHAVLALGDKSRSLAIAELKKRDQHNYVPMLLAGLSMPIESSYALKATPDGSLYYIHSLYQEGQEADHAADYYFATQQFYFPGIEYGYEPQSGRVSVLSDLPAEHAAKIARKVAANRERYTANVQTVEEKVAETNQASKVLSQQIMSVLAATSDKSFATAKQWWDWWDDRNEYYSSGHPVDQQAYSDIDRRVYGQPGDCMTIQRHSCFAKGTIVWTKIGRVPIESVEVGDFVLSQDVNTGELSYKPVLTTTHWPGSKMMTLSLVNEKFTATPGHAFWIAGSGWRMAKELGDDARLYGLGGGTRLQAIATTTDADAYNLVVADFNTYFVGQAGILVHDVTPRQPTISAVPGVGKK